MNIRARSIVIEDCRVLQYGSACGNEYLMRDSTSPMGRSPRSTYIRASHKPQPVLIPIADLRQKRIGYFRPPGVWL